MRIFVNDANILIYLVQLGCVEAFFELNGELCTTDFVLEELEADQRELFKRSSMRICTSNPKLISEILELTETNPGLSFEDCSVWHHAKLLGGILVTGDGKLRRKASAGGLEVRGIIFLIEEIKSQRVRELVECISILKHLKSINQRLPILEIDNRINAWEVELANQL
jgi:rRNA-processing protein FCF1